jgi:hypothetical protein
MMDNYRGKIIKDWGKVDYRKLFVPEEKDVQHQRAVMKALQFFLAIPNTNVPAQFAGNEKFKKAQMQYFATLNDFPATAKEVIDKYHELAVYDNGFEQIFNMRDYTGSRRDGFSIDTIRGGLTFRKMLTGEKLHVYQMSGEREFVYFDYYGGALGWDRKLFENQDWWQLEENAIEFRNEAYRIRAATFYALLEAVGTAAGWVDIPWQASPDGLAAGVRGYQAQRDAATMNLAAQTILLACQASGYGISAQNVSFIVLAPIQLRARIKRALGSTYDVMAGAPPVIDYSFSTVITTMLAVTDHYWIILPKRKIVGGDRLNLETYSEFDMLSRTDSAAGWMAFAGGVGDTDQMERCDIT